jgi:hypothetical protein
MKSMIPIAAMLAFLSAPGLAQEAITSGVDGGDARFYVQAMPHPPEPPAPPDAPCPPDQPCPRDPEMEKERRMLEAIRVTRMTEALKLTDEQVAKFIPRLKKNEEQRRQLREERARMLKQLAEMLDKAERRRELKLKLEELDKLERDQMQKAIQTMKDLDTLLSTEQQARWRVFNERFDGEIREMVREIRKKRMDHHRMRQW